MQVNDASSGAEITQTQNNTIIVRVKWAWWQACLVVGSFGAGFVLPILVLKLLE